ncbi:MAG: 2-oxoglutarate dehydrogenase complex dihydrolipoyllysine-residue succinyltransferase [Alphaproteobacteria bacterium]
MADMKTPALGESVSEATVARWIKKPGDAVKKDEILVELETDKVSLEVASPADGVLEAINAAEGATVTPGTLLGSVTAGKAAAAAPPPAAVPAPTPAPAPAASVPAAPSAARLAAESNLELSAVAGSGKDGRVTKGDALAALEARSTMPAAPAVASASRPTHEREERVKMTRLRQTIARRLKEAQNSAAMLTTFNEVDMTAVMALRNQYKDAFEKRHGVKLGFMSFFVKAVIAALQATPDVNAEIDGDTIVYKNHYDIGVAVGTEKGLVVPVVRDADAMNLAQIEKTIGDLGKRARAGQLGIDELQGGTFTITNGGIYGSLMSTPILNAPQSGILGMHAIKDRPIAINGKIEIRPMMYLALSYDHRVVDGAGAVTFLVKVKDAIEDPQRLLLDL